MGWHYFFIPPVFLLFSIPSFSLIVERGGLDLYYIFRVGGRYQKLLYL